MLGKGAEGGVFVSEGWRGGGGAGWMEGGRGGRLGI